MGISAKFINILKNLYNGANISIKVGKDVSGSVTLREGFLQGEILSPLLFAIYINDLEDYLRKSKLSGINVDGETDIILLAYADDLALVSDSPISLQRKLNILERYCDANLLTINVAKTNFLPFHQGRGPEPWIFKYKESVVEVVNNFCYLGVNFSSSGKFLAKKSITGIDR
ncbi:Reverse transcriptase (RNA-dependent DNA polymerase) [Popillia japonica]|uniref:Reverse transcriptase (RNA-dependent DNA polymerase) n=1 Tax=Popillia japonica TaxID=7064 RepID=A0AAW1N3V7_POPJA